MTSDDLNVSKYFCLTSLVNNKHGYDVLNMYLCFNGIAFIFHGALIIINMRTIKVNYLKNRKICIFVLWSTDYDVQTMHFCYNEGAYNIPQAPKDTAYTRWSCHSGMPNHVQIVSNPPAPSNAGPITVLWASRPCGPAGWMALLLTKASDVETNPGPTTLGYTTTSRYRYGATGLNTGCTLHIRCAGIRLAQYTDTGTCHHHR